MRTTLDIDIDVLEAAKQRARREKKTMGKVISELARYALTSSSLEPARRDAVAVHGFAAFSIKGGVVMDDRNDGLVEDDAA